METNPLNRDVFAGNVTSRGPVTSAMVRTRAGELAQIAGHVAPYITQADYDQAKRELADGPRSDLRETDVEAIPESERWDPVPGSAGHQTLEPPSEDEDDEGRSETEQRVEDGVEAADRDQVRQAARAALRHPAAL